MNKNEEFSLLLQAKRKFTKVVRNIFVVLLILSMSFTSYAKHKKSHSPRVYHKEIGYSNVGQATYYGNEYKGYTRTANGEKFNMYAMTCASNTHAFGTWLKVENLSNGKYVIVRVTDRGGFRKGNVDLTYGAFGKIAPYKAGRIKVKITVVQAP